VDTPACHKVVVVGYGTMGSYHRHGLAALPGIEPA
jgi:hypothetical protein